MLLLVCKLYTFITIIKNSKTRKKDAVESENPNNIETKPILHKTNKAGP